MRKALSPRGRGLLATLSWTFRDTHGPADLSVSRQGERILLKGRFEGQPVKRILKIDGQPWRQLFGPGDQGIGFRVTRPEALHHAMNRGQGGERV